MLRRSLSILTLFLALVVGTSAHAQAAPQYRLTILDAGITTDQCSVRIQVSVGNTGSLPTETTQLLLRTATATTLASADVLPVSPEAPPIFELVGDRRALPAGEQIFIVTLEGEGASWFPTPDVARTLSIPPLPPTCGGAAVGGLGLGLGSFVVDIPLVNVRIDLLNPTLDEAFFLAGLALAVLIVLLLPILIFRRLTRRPPAFGTQLPPYATTPPLDPHSEAGIRHGWQLAAQNNLISAAPTPQAVGGVKLLVNADGDYLDGWDITALRLSQYDQYGRVARSLTLADGGTVRTLNRLAHNRKLMAQPNLDKRANQIERQIAPMARKLSAHLLKRITPRSAVLPVALDVRLRGEHGEVKIVFQLFQYDGAGWREVKRWEPEMHVTTGTIYESYTYTLHGQTQNESMKDYQRRLPLDVARVLTDFVTPPTPVDSPNG